jgi:uracil-DNA glycosylase
MLLPYHPRFLLWNAVPLHPHRPERKLSIRTPRASEIAAVSPLLGEMYRLIEPERVVALGRKAEIALGQAGVPCTYVRHPSQRGLPRFREGMEQILREMEAISHQSSAPTDGW